MATDNPVDTDLVSIASNGPISRDQCAPRTALVCALLSFVLGLGVIAAAVSITASIWVLAAGGYSRGQRICACMCITLSLLTTGATLLILSAHVI